MTCIDVETNASSTYGSRAGEGRRKSVLFCPVCEHENPVDGEWTVRLTGRGTKFVCPKCDTVVAMR